MADDTGRINQVLAETSFLYGANAPFVEDLYSRWAGDPKSVEPSWQAFFATLRDRTDEVKQAAEPSWTPVLPPAPRADWVSAIDGFWPAVEARSPRPSPSAIPPPPPSSSAPRPWIPCAR